MAFQLATGKLSPGVSVSEIDLTTVVPSVITSSGAFAGNFNWGPANQIILVDSELTLLNTFGAPDSNTATSFFTCANFLAYGNNLNVVRAVSSNTYNATTINYSYFDLVVNNVTGNFSAGEIVFQSADSTLANAEVSGSVISWSNVTNTLVIMNSSSGTRRTGNVTVFETWVDGNTVFGYTSSANAVLQTATNTPQSNTIQIQNSDVYQYQYLNRDNDNLYGPFAAKYPGVLGNSLKVSVWANTELAAYNSWDFASFFPGPPGTSDWAANINPAANDEMHIVVIDGDGLISGVVNGVLETFAYVSKASDATYNGQSNYYKQVLFNQSNWIYSMDPPDYAETNGNWDQPITANTSYVQLPAVDIPYILGGGTLVQPDDSDLIQDGWSLFQNKQSVEISLVPTADASTTVQQYVIDNIVNARADCVAFISPPANGIINNVGSEIFNIENWLSILARSSSYVVADSGWKYQFDVYNNTYRWIPLNGDIAGLCVYTDATRDPWYSPAGFNRGSIKNAIKLAWNPSQGFRDRLYTLGVNPVVSFPGQGIVLYGDKTLQSKPSAFDRINVRRLFISLEKAISRAAQYSLFELNDEFTRAQFIALVTPFLRDVQGRRGITDFKVVCDTTNNTPYVIDTNQFVGDIYVKPARSINFIQLNFVAVATGVDFTTIVGT